jgi:hypothetical protein
MKAPVSCKLIGKWGGRPRPRPTPSSASVLSVLEQPDQGVRRGRGRPPHFVIATLLLVFPLGAQTLDECRALRHHGQLTEAQTCYAKLAASPNPYLRAEGFWGTERFQEANTQFRDLIKQNPKNADSRERWGRLFFERYNNE